MKGAHRIIVESRKVKYDFTIRRNITLLTGDSGTGKTVLIDLIREYRRYGTDSGVLVSCDRPCRTLDNEDWARQLEEITDSIIFIDEGNRFLPSQQFAELIQHSGNYFVLATREKLPMLPYSIEEIYGFRPSGRFHNARQTYNELYHLYGTFSEENGISPDLIITEDSNSGYEFFSYLATQKKAPCLSAGGKSSVIKTLQKCENKAGTILLIVDGAAYGSEMRDTCEYLKNHDAVLYAPESFEWLLLSSNVIPGSDVTAILGKPEDYIESSDFFSWERFFTNLLIEKTSTNALWKYSKRKLRDIYLSSRVVQAVKHVMKMISWD